MAMTKVCSHRKLASTVDDDSFGVISSQMANMRLSPRHCPETQIDDMEDPEALFEFDEEVLNGSSPPLQQFVLGNSDKDIPHPHHPYFPANTDCRSQLLNDDIMSDRALHLLQHRNSALNNNTVTIRGSSGMPLNVALSSSFTRRTAGSPSWLGTGKFKISRILVVLTFS